MHDHTETFLWAIIHGLGWTFWGGIAFLAAWNMFGMMKLAPAGTRFGWLIRAVLGFGYFLIATSPWNTGFGPFGLLLVLVGNRMLLHQMYRDCVRLGKVGPFWPPIWAWVHHNVIHGGHKVRPRVVPPHL